MTTTERIDYILKSRGMSRRQLAIAAKIPPSSLQSAMTKGKSMSLDMLLHIAEALQVNPYTLFDFDDASNLIFARINGERKDRLLNAFSLLNDIGQQQAIEYLEMLSNTEKYTEK